MTLPERKVDLIGVASGLGGADAACAQAPARLAAAALARVMDDALAIANEGTAGFGVTLDLDALDPREVPAVATPASFGIRGDELLHDFARLGRDPRLVAFELAEYCPRLDPDGRSERLIGRLLCAALGGARENSQVLADAIH